MVFRSMVLARKVDQVTAISWNEAAQRRPKFKQDGFLEKKLACQELQKRTRWISAAQEKAMQHNIGVYEHRGCKAETRSVRLCYTVE